MYVFNERRLIWFAKIYAPRNDVNLVNELKERSDGLKATADEKDVEIQEVIRQIAEAKANLQVTMSSIQFRCNTL